MQKQMQKQMRSPTAEMIYRLDGPLRWALGEAVELVRKLQLNPGANVLDVGAGTGFMTLPLAEVVSAGGTVTALDGNQDLLAALQRKLVRHRLTDRVILVHGSAQKLPFADESFDAVSCTYLMHELTDDAAVALSEMRRVLKPLGQLVIADYRRIPDSRRRREIERWYQAQPDGGGRDERHLRLSLSDMERLLQRAGLRVVSLSTWADFHMHVLARK